MMPETEPLLAALLVGLLGGTHCIGMCGGIVVGLTAGLAPAVQQSRLRLFLTQLTYNTGRIASYVLAGFIAGAIGQKVSLMEWTAGIPVGRILAATIMILMGLHLGGWWPALAWLERGGAFLWRYIEPLGRPLLPVRNPFQALLLGLVWGWLPCGLVYSALALALASGSATDGGLIMLAFGLGTLPTLVVMGMAFGVLRGFLQDVRVRRVAGLLVIALGLFLLLANSGGHMHHAHPH